MIRAALISLPVAATSIAQPAFADWGGVAVNEGTTGWGYSAGWKTKRDARNRAMHYCKQYSNGVAGCEVVMTTQKCGAVVRSKTSSPQFYVVSANTKASASRQALAQCKAAHGSSCDLRQEFCADDL